MFGWRVIPRIELGRFSVSPHGLGIALGYFVGTLLMVRRARARGFNEDHAWNAAAVAVVGAILGARVAYIAGHSEQFSSAVEWLQIYKGGISLFGGLLGGFLAAFIYARIKRFSFTQLADLGAPGLAIGTAIGRIGDLIIGDHLGKPTSFWGGWQYRGGELVSPPPCVYPTPDGCIRPGMVVHQTALYDSVWSLIIFLVLLRLERKPRRQGFLVATWALLYSLGRIVTDFLRVDKQWFGSGLTGSQLTAIAVAVLSVALLLRLRGSPKPAGVSAPPSAAVEPAPTPTVGPEQPVMEDAREQVHPGSPEGQVVAGETAPSGEAVPGDVPREVVPGDVPREAVPGEVPREAVPGEAPPAALPGEAAPLGEAALLGDDAHGIASSAEARDERRPEEVAPPDQPAELDWDTVFGPDASLRPEDQIPEATGVENLPPGDRPGDEFPSLGADQPPVEEQVAAADAAMEELEQAMREAGVTEPGETWVSGEEESQRVAGESEEERTRQPPGDSTQANTPEGGKTAPEGPEGRPA